MKARVVLAAVVIMVAAGRLAVLSAQEHAVEAMVLSANAAYIEALSRYQRLLTEHDLEGLPPEDLRVLIDTTDRMLWAAAAMAGMCASARAIPMALAKTRCAEVDADAATLERQRADLLARAGTRP